MSQEFKEAALRRQRKFARYRLVRKLLSRAQTRFEATHPQLTGAHSMMREEQASRYRSIADYLKSTQKSKCALALSTTRGKMPGCILRSFIHSEYAGGGASRSRATMAARRMHHAFLLAAHPRVQPDDVACTHAHKKRTLQMQNMSSYRRQRKSSWRKRLKPRWCWRLLELSYIYRHMHALK